MSTVARVYDKIQGADVIVASDYGIWDPQTGQVQPGGLPEMPVPDDGEDGPARVG